MTHHHIYDKDGKQLCCTQEDKINKLADVHLKHEDSCCSADKHMHEHSDDDGHDHSGGNQSTFSMFIPSIISLLLL